MQKTKFTKILSIILLFAVSFTSVNVEAFSGIEKINQGPLIAMAKPVTVMNEENTSSINQGEEEGITSNDIGDEGEGFSGELPVDIEEGSSANSSEDTTEDSELEVEHTIITDESEVELKEPENYYEEDEPVDGEIILVDEDSVTYQTGTRTFTTVVGGAPIVYENEHGEIEEIDNTLIEVPGSEVYENTSNAYSIELPKEITDRYGIIIEKDGHRVELIPTEGDFSNSVAKENAILYNEVFPGIDYQYTVLGNNIKEDIVLKEPSDKTDFYFEIKTSLSVEQRGDDLEGRIYLSEDGEDVFALSAPVMMDADGEISFGVGLVLENIDGRYIARVTPSKDWLSDPERKYPVRIDPEVITLGGDKVRLYSIQEDVPYGRGSDDFIYAGYDDGEISTNYEGFRAAHLRTRAYVEIKYDFTNIPEESKIKSAKLTIDQRTNWSGGRTQFDIYYVEKAWSASSIGWKMQESFPFETLATGIFDSKNLRTTWDITEAVNNWSQGIKPQYGLVVKAINELSDQCESFYGSDTEYPPKLVIEWEIPDPVDPNYSLDGTKISLHPITEKDIKGKQVFDGVFAEGVAKPKSIVGYELNPGKLSALSLAYASYKFPDSTDFAAAFPNGTKYKAKDGNWQTGLFTSSDLKKDTIYKITAQATDGTNVGKAVDSDTFLIYQVKGNETLPNIAKYYGVKLETIMKDNHVQDTLVIQNNTIFIRNPKKSKAYVSKLTIDDKKKIDAALIGRGLHCEYGYEPINLNTGNFYLNSEDVSIDDLGGVFGIERTYNSKADFNNTVFGQNWSFKYDEHLSKLENGDLLYSTSDGKILVFTYDDGKYLPPSGYHYEVKELPYKVKIPEEDQEEDGPAEYELTRYEICETDGSYKSFDAFGQLEKVVDKYGYETSLTYDEDLNLTIITSPSGKAFNLSYDDRGKITEIKLPNGGSLKYSYDDDDNLISFTDANGGVIHYEYNGNLMTSWKDQEGNRVVLNEYDKEGRVVKQTDANGNVSSLAYTANSTTTVDANGNKTVYTYDDLKRTTRIEHTNGKVETFSYDEDNNLASDYDLTYTYDERGNVLTETRKDGASRIYTYNNNNDVTSVTDYDGSVTKFEYSGLDLIKITYPDGSIHAYTYDNLHRVTSHTNGEGDTETFSYDGVNISSYSDFNGNTYILSYDKHNNLVSVTDPLANVTSYSYNGSDWLVGEYLPDGSSNVYTFDKAGDVLSIKDGNGGVSTFTYDGVGNILTAKDPKGNTISYSYDGVYNVLSETDALGRVSSYSYDAPGNVTSFIDANGNETSFTYDVDGNLLETIYPDGSATSASYDELNRITSGTDELGNVTTFSYDIMSNITGITYPDGTSLSYSYDNLGNLISFTDETGLEIIFAYDSNSNITSLKQGDRIYQYFYDANSNLIKTIDSMGYECAYTYDALNRAVSETNENGAETKYSYDALGRITSLADALGNKTIAEYDLNGNLKRAVTPRGGEYLYNYSSINNLISEKNPIGSITNYEYNGVEELVKVTDALGGETKYSYDNLSNVTRVTDALGNSADLTYDSKGNLTSITFSNGDSSIYEYDLKGRLVKATDAAGLITEYIYDAMDRIIHEKDNAGNEASYSYDDKGRLIEIKDVIGRSEEYTYNDYSEITSIKEIDGNVSTFTYDDLGRLSTNTDHKGITTCFSYDAVGNLIEENTNDEKIYKYTYDLINRVTEVTNPIKATTKYSYDEEGNILSITDGNSIETRYEYNPVSDVVKYIDGNKGETSLEYDALNRLIKLTQPEGDSEEYRYDAVSNLIQLKDPKSYVTEYEYDIFGNLIKEISPRGAVTEYTYDKHNNVTEMKDALGYTTKYDVDLNGLTTKATLPNGGEYLYTYDEVHRITGIKTPNGYEKTLTYDDKGNITEETDNLDRTYSYSYDLDHNITEVINPNGLKTTYSYDNYSNLLTILEGKDKKSSYTYDLLDRVTSETDPEKKLTKISYDKEGNVTSVTLPGNRKTAYSYDGNYNAISITDPMGYVSILSYDKNDRLISVTDAKGYSESYSYDLSGQVVGIEDRRGNARSFTYDPHGNISKSVNEKGKTLTYAYDLVDNLTSVSSGIIGEVRYEYDSMGNVISSLTGSGKTLYSYDLENNLTEIKDPRGKIEKQEYDLAGNIKKSVRPDSTSTTYDYDKLNSLVSKEYSEDSSSVIYLYDSYGNRTEMKDPQGDTEYSYDIMDRLTLVKDTYGREVKYSYDDAGRLESITYPEGNIVSYAYDLNDRLIEVDDSGKVTRYTYDEVNLLTSTIRPDGSKTTYSYDEDGNVTELVNKDSSGKSISTFKYTYDETRNIVKEESSNNGENFTREFKYNDAEELVSFTETGSDFVSQNYEYDNAGNRTKLTTNDETITYSYNGSNQLTSKNSSKDGKTTYSYDKSGNLIKEASAGEVITYEYTVAQRLAAVRSNGELLMAASYDGDGNRIFKMSMREYDENTPSSSSISGMPLSAPKESTDVVDSEEYINNRGINTYSEKEYVDPADSIFWYGFGQSFLNLSAGGNQALAVTTTSWLHDAWNSVTEKFDVILHYAEYDKTYIESMRKAGLTEEEIKEIQQGIYKKNNEGMESNSEANPLGAQKQPSSPESAYQPSSGIQIPSVGETVTHVNYELTYYVNDINRENVEVLSEYGNTDALVNTYVYGNQRISIDTNNPNLYNETGLSYYLYDGRGSVSDVTKSNSVLSSYSYDPFGNILGKLPDNYSNYYGYNAEDTSLVTDLQYLRYRYYNYDDGRFDAIDNYLGRTSSPLSLNRYAYTENNPVSYIDPSGHVPTYATLMSDGGGGKPYNKGGSKSNTTSSISTKKLELIEKAFEGTTVRGVNTLNKTLTTAGNGLKGAPNDYTKVGFQIGNSKYTNILPSLADIISKRVGCGEQSDRIKKQNNIFKKIYGFDAKQTQLLFDAASIMDINSKSISRKNKINEEAGIFVGLSTAYQGFMFRWTANTPKMSKATMQLAYGGMDYGDVKVLTNTVNSQHSSTYGLSDIIYAGSQYYTWTYKDYASDNQTLVDFAHQMYVISAFSNEENQSIFRKSANLVNNNDTNYVSSYTGDVYTSFDKRDYLADVDGINIYYMALRNNDTLTNVIYAYYEGIEAGNINRSKQLLLNLGDGSYLRGAFELYRSLNSNSPGLSYLSMNRDYMIIQANKESFVKWFEEDLYA